MKLDLYTVNLDEDSLKTGDLLICSADRVISKAIKAFTGSKVSHTAHVVKVHGKVLIVEAQMRGVHIITYEEWVKRYGYKYVVARPQHMPNRNDFARDAFSKTSFRNYDIRAILIDFPWFLMTGKWIGEKTEAAVLLDNKFNCSTLSGYLYKFDNWWKMTPQDIYEEVTIVRYEEFKIL